jgi:hypothetical protein
MKLPIISSQRPSKRLLAAAIVGFFFGIIWFVLLRVAFYDKEPTHFHANFALYINGDRELFTDPSYYEEISSCGDKIDDPLSRVHMHDNNADTVHIHDASATWGNFFENLGLVLGDNVLYYKGKTYTNNDSGKLMFMLNGSRVYNIAAKSIKSEDKLLISYDTDASVLQNQFNSIASSAAKYNETADPASCSGSGTPTDFWSKLRDVVGI